MWHGKRLAPFSDDVALEKFVAALWEQRHPRGAAPRMGRDGQAQGGLDVLVRTADGRAIGIQCKAVAKLTPKLLNDQVARAVASGIRLDEFVLASSALHDAPTVVAAHELSDAHRARGLFPVTVYGWNELQRTAEAYPALIAQFFPEVAGGAGLTARVVLSVDADSTIPLSDLELTLFCSEAAAQLRDAAGAVVVVHHATEQDLLNEVALSGGDLPEQRIARSNLRARLADLSPRVRDLEVAVGLLLGDEAAVSPWILGHDWAVAADVLRELVPCVLAPAKTSDAGKLALKLRAPRRSALMTYIDLPKPDGDAFRTRNPDHRPEYFLAGVVDLGPDLGRRHALPAALAAIARHWRTHAVPIAELKRERSTSIYDWRVEAA